MEKKIKGKTPIEEKENRKQLLFMLEEAIPTAQNERKKYMADIALFYATVFKAKLKHFKGMQLEELAQIGRTELGSNIIRANINCFNLIDEWMEEKTNEHIGNVEEIRNSFSDDKEFINNIKKTYGKSND